MVLNVGWEYQCTSTCVSWGYTEDYLIKRNFLFVGTIFLDCIPVLLNSLPGRWMFEFSHQSLPSNLLGLQGKSSITPLSCFHYKNMPGSLSLGIKILIFLMIHIYL